MFRYRVIDLSCIERQSGSMKCDLHVHTTGSGMCSIPVLRRVCRESYNDPQALYETLKRRGMDLVTVTDHDSVDASEALRKHPDFFLSEEVTCTTPAGTRIHVGVYGITEQQHVEMQRRKNDLPSLLHYFNENRLLFSVNHLFSGLTGRRTEDDFEYFARYFPALETLNGQMLAVANRAAQQLAARWGKISLAGSDAHTASGLGRACTEVPGARNFTEFLAGAGQGHTVIHGDSGDYLALTRAVLEIGACFLADFPKGAFLAPAFALVPLITLANYALEKRFAHLWTHRLALASPLRTYSESASSLAQV